MAISEISSFQRDWKDLDLRLILHPSYSDVRPLVELDAVKNAIKNIINTRPGEKPFNPNFGCDLTSFLFEPMDFVVEFAIRETIEHSLKQFEPRIRVIKVDTVPYYKDNKYDVIIDCVLINNEIDFTVKFTLERLR